MLTPQYLEQCPNALIELYAQAESDIIADMARKISEYDYFVSSADWQRKKVQEMGLAYEDILKRLSAQTGKTTAELKKLLKEAGIKALSADDTIYEKAGLTPEPLNASPELQSVLLTGLKRTNDSFINLTKTTAQNGTKQFSDALDRAYMQIITGAFDQNTAIRNAVKDLAKNGLDSIKYPTRTDSLEAAVRRAVVTGVNQTCGRLQEARAEEMDSDLVEVTAHSGARPSHEAWQGKIFSLSGKHPKYPSLKEVTGYGTAGGLKGVNCRHDFYPFIEGISEPAYTDKELKKLEEKTYKYNDHEMTEYEATQRQRYIERNIRRWKREKQAMKVAGLSTQEAKAKIGHWTFIQKDFIRQTGLKRQIDREMVVKFVASTREYDIIKVHKTLPKAKPNMITQVDGANGGVSRNFYDNEGKWKKQITNNDHGNPKYHPFGEHGEHAHDIIWEDGKIINRPKRGLTETERKENGDIL